MRAERPPLSIRMPPPPSTHLYSTPTPRGTRLAALIFLSHCLRTSPLDSSSYRPLSLTRTHFLSPTLSSPIKRLSSASPETCSHVIPPCAPYTPHRTAHPSPPHPTPPHPTPPHRTPQARLRDHASQSISVLSTALQIEVVLHCHRHWLDAGAHAHTPAELTMIHSSRIITTSSLPPHLYILATTDRHHRLCPPPAVHYHLPRSSPLAQSGFSAGSRRRASCASPSPWPTARSPQAK